MLASQLFPWVTPWKNINTENFVIRGTNLKGHMPLCWISFNLSDTFKTRRWTRSSNHFVLLFPGEKKRTTNYFLCDVLDHGWYEFQLKYWSLCFGFWLVIAVFVLLFWGLYKNQRKKKFLNSVSHFPL